MARRGVVENVPVKDHGGCRLSLGGRSRRNPPRLGSTVIGSTDCFWRWMTADESVEPASISRGRGLTREPHHG